MTQEQADRLEKILLGFQSDFEESSFVETLKQKLDAVEKAKREINKYLDEKTKNTPKIFKKLHRKYLIYKLNKHYKNNN